VFNINMLLATALFLLFAAAGRLLVGAWLLLLS
jgi:hypothetical protein